MTCIVFEKDLWLQLTVNFTVGLVNLCYLVRYQPFDDSRVNKLEVMNEATNFIMLYHVMCFTDLVPEAENRYMIGWSFVAMICMNLMVHLTLLFKDTIAGIKESCKEKCCKKKGEPEEEEIKKKELSVILEDAEFQSNFSDKEEHVRKRDDKLSDSHWESERMGGTIRGGYNLAEIQWTDLGRKYMIKRGNKTNQVDYDESHNQQVCHTIEDNMSSSRPIMQKELEDEIVRLPLALTKRQSEQLNTARHFTKGGDFDDDDDDDEITGSDDEEDKSDFSSEQVNKSEML